MTIQHSRHGCGSCLCSSPREVCCPGPGINAVLGLLGLGMPLLMQLLTDDVLVRGDRQLLASLGVAMTLCLPFAQ